MLGVALPNAVPYWAAVTVPVYVSKLISTGFITVVFIAHSLPMIVGPPVPPPPVVVTIVPPAPPVLTFVVEPPPPPLPVVPVEPPFDPPPPPAGVSSALDACVHAAPAPTVAASNRARTER